MRWTWTAAALAASVVLGSCDDPAVVLVVDVKTDYLPGYQFVGVRTEVGDPALEAIARQSDSFASVADDYLGGERVAELSDLAPGESAVRVSLIDETGATLATRTTLVRVSGQHALTVLITSSCEGVTCPGPADDPSLSACVGGRCVDPRCSPETPELCGQPGCVTDADCSSSVSCTDAVCVSSECFQRPDDSRCRSSELCNPQLGCVPRPDVDAGPVCPATESSCGDGIDDDCDGATDCADSDCLGTPCDDGTVCTENDICRGDGTCGGVAITCDDGVLCTDDTCDPELGCTFTDNTAECDDGFWCNGPDRCNAGTCTPTGAAPCDQFCNETSMACEQCQTDSDCGSPTTGTWSACDYSASNSCDESASRSRTIQTPRCISGMCTVETSTETEACSRNTDGNRCGTTTYSGWSGCNWANACDESARQTRTRTERRCSAGSCRNQNTTERRDCSRNVANGTRCGGTWLRCCGGSCRNLKTNRYCGACGVNCNAINEDCAGTGTGGYACRGCETNAECRSILNSRATCYTSGASFCNCQCPGGQGVCANAGCGANMYCHDCSGHNFCAPFGGSC